MSRPSRPTEDRLDLFAWVTLANGDETSFANANTQAVAGQGEQGGLQSGRPPCRGRS
jgi:hypothetical protein